LATGIAVLLLVAALSLSLARARRLDGNWTRVRPFEAGNPAGLPASLPASLSASLSASLIDSIGIGSHARRTTVLAKPAALLRELGEICLQRARQQQLDQSDPEIARLVARLGSCLQRLPTLAEADSPWPAKTPRRAFGEAYEALTQLEKRMAFRGETNGH
ncbi:MAG: hypothetical protein V2A73_07730, partial [Pseudomonadota bacterium]